MNEEFKDLTGENIFRENRRIGAVEAGNKFVAHCELTEEDKEYVRSLGLTPPEPPIEIEGPPAEEEAPSADDAV